MPDGAADSRSEPLSTLEGIAHRLLVAVETAELLDQAGTSDGLDHWRRSNLREMRRIYRHAAAVPEDVVEANSRAVARAKDANYLLDSELFSKSEKTWLLGKSARTVHKWGA